MDDWEDGALYLVAVIGIIVMIMDLFVWRPY